MSSCLPSLPARFSDSSVSGALAAAASGFGPVDTSRRVSRIGTLQPSISVAESLLHRPRSPPFLSALWLDLLAPPVPKPYRLTSACVVVSVTEPSANAPRLYAYTQC